MNRGAVSVEASAAVSDAMIELDRRLSSAEATLNRLRGDADRLPVDAAYTDATRPLALAQRVGTRIWNKDDNAPNWSDGTNWRDASGGLT